MGKAAQPLYKRRATTLIYASLLGIVMASVLSIFNQIALQTHRPKTGPAIEEQQPDPPKTENRSVALQKLIDAIRMIIQLPAR